MDILRYKRNESSKQVDPIFSSFGKKGRLSCILITLSPGGSTSCESHPEEEYWGVISGKGKVLVDQKIDYLNPGDFIKIPPGKKHKILNESPDEALVFITIYEMNEKKTTLGSVGQDIIMTNLVISSYPTPNGDLHLGHIGGPFLPSDIMHRANKIKGEESYFFSGTLGHQNYVDKAAKRKNMMYYDFASIMSKKIENSLHGMKIKPTIFLDPIPDHDFIKLNDNIFSSLHKKNLVIRKKSPLLADSESGRIVSESELQGKCPHCMSVASGNDCEKCGNFHDDFELIDPIILNDNRSLTPIVTERERFFFPLEMFRTELVDYFSSIPLSIGIKDFIDNVFGKTLPEVPLTHFKETGINCPYGNENEKYNSTFEHLTKVIYSIYQVADCEDKKNKLNISMFFGVDNLFYKVILLPALLISAGYRNYLPNYFYMNKFLLLDGLKFSTSRNHAIWARDIDENHNEYVRIYLAYKGPSSIEKNYTSNELLKFIDDFYYKGLDKIVQKATSFMKAYDLKKIPEPGEWQFEHKSFLKKIVLHHEVMSEAISTKNGNFSPHLIVCELKSLISSTLIYLESIDIDSRLLLSRELRSQMALTFCSLAVVYAFMLPIIGDKSKHINLIEIDDESLKYIYENGPLFLKGNAFIL